MTSTSTTVGTTPGLLLVATGHVAANRVSPYGAFTAIHEVIEAFGHRQYAVRSGAPETLFDPDVLSTKMFVSQDQAALDRLAGQVGGMVESGPNPFGTELRVVFQHSFSVSPSSSAMKWVSGPWTVWFDGFHLLAFCWLRDWLPEQLHLLTRHPQFLDDAFTECLGVEMLVSWHMVYNWHNRALNSDVEHSGRTEPLYPNLILRLESDLMLAAVNPARLRPTSLPQWVGANAEASVLPFLMDREAIFLQVERTQFLLRSTFGLNLDPTLRSTAAMSPPNSLDQQNALLGELHQTWQEAQARFVPYQQQADMMLLMRAVRDGLEAIRERGMYRRLNPLTGIIYGPYRARLDQSTGPSSYSLHWGEVFEDRSFRFATLETILARAENEQQAFQQNLEVLTGVQGVGVGMIGAYTAATSLRAAERLGKLGLRVSVVALIVTVVNTILALAALWISAHPLR